jgi:hypothetical protein
VGGQAAKNAAAAARQDDQHKALPPLRKASSSDNSPPPPASHKDKNNIRNKEIQKVLAENISEASDKQRAAAPTGKKNTATHQQNNNKARVGGSRSHSNDYDEDDVEDEDEEDNEFHRNQNHHHNHNGRRSDDEEDADVDAFHQTVQDLFDEEEDLLNLHMGVIQENAELLTEEGRLLQQIQSENNDIDAYAARLDLILQRKQELIAILREKLDHFRKGLIREEKESKHLASKINAY